MKEVHLHKKSRKDRIKQYGTYVAGEDQPGSIATHPLFHTEGDLTEAAVLKEVQRTIRNLGGWSIRVTPGRLSKAGKTVQNITNGTPDLIASIPSPQGKYQILLAIECKKRKGGRLSVDQVAFEKKAKQDNRLFYVIHSGKELIAKLERDGLLVSDPLFANFKEN